MRQEVLDIIINSLNDTASTLGYEMIFAEPPEKTSIYGPDGDLDSLSLVTLVVAIEEAVEDKFEIPLILADEKAISQVNSPFMSIESLINYVLKLLEEKSSG